MDKKYSNIWIRLAVNKQGIKEGSGNHWRVYLNKAGDLVPIKTWKTIGNATATNIVPGSDTSFDQNGLLAWIDIYGNVTIIEDNLTVELLEPFV